MPPSITCKKGLSLGLVLVAGYLLLALLAIDLRWPRLTGADAPSCRMSFMVPAYARIRAFDTSYTPLASKYSLYLYREQDRDIVPDPHLLSGIPALFIPGNAGSFRQVRLIAADTSNLFFDEYEHSSVHRNYDFFALDFNEDFTAFHGKTMWDQAQYANEAVAYILSLYSLSPNPPQLVLLLAHSMGGVVARVMVTLDNYRQSLVTSIVTLASPHATLPLTFDGDLLKLYTHTNLFWAEGFASDRNAHAHRIVSPIMLVSITGGLVDTMLPADYTATSHIVPVSNGLTLFSTGIPHVWTPIDHLAIMWCKQLRRQVARLLIEISNFSSPDRTVPLPQRLRTMKKHLLPNFEDRIPSLAAEETLDLDASLPLLRELRIEPSQRIPHTNVFSRLHNHNFTLLTLGNIVPWKDARHNHELLVFLCRDSNTDSHACIDVSELKQVVPRLGHDTQLLQDSSLDGHQIPFASFTLAPYEYPRYSRIVVRSKYNAYADQNIFIVASLDDTESCRTTINASMALIWSRGLALYLPGNRPVLLSVNVPGAWSSLVAYRLHVSFSGPDHEPPLFSPLIRQWVQSLHETKWHINLGRHDNLVRIQMHSIAPYIPFKNDKRDYALNLDLWSDPHDGRPARLTLRVDVLASLGLLYLRYRLALVAGCVLVLLLVMALQCGQFFCTGKVPGFVQAMQLLNSPRRLAAILAVLALLTPLCQWRALSVMFNMLDPVVWRDRNEAQWLFYNPSYDANSFYLGLEENVLWWLGPLFYAASQAMVATTFMLVMAAGHAAAYGATKVRQFFPQKGPLSPALSAAPLWLYRRALALLALIILIAVYVPYQVVYMVCTLIQVFLVLKQCVGRDTSSNLFHMRVSLLVLMLWVLPVNVPIVVVFMHNITVNWKTPFSSHHNLLLIVPILWLVERVNGARQLHRIRSRTAARVLQAWLYTCVAYCVLFGVRHTYWIHHLLNVLACFLLVTVFGFGLFLAKSGTDSGSELPQSSVEVN